MQCKKELTEFWVDVPSPEWCEVCGNRLDPARRAAAAGECLWSLVLGRQGRLPWEMCPGAPVPGLGFSSGERVVSGPATVLLLGFCFSKHYPPTPGVLPCSLPQTLPLLWGEFLLAKCSNPGLIVALSQWSCQIGAALPCVFPAITGTLWGLDCSTCNSASCCTW